MLINGSVASPHENGGRSGFNGNMFAYVYSSLQGVEIVRWISEPRQEVQKPNQDDGDHCWFSLGLHCHGGTDW